MLIDVSYFTAGPRQILNATLGNGTSRENAIIKQYITEYQGDFLRRALGVGVSDSVEEYLAAHDNDPYSPADASIESVCSKLRKAFADFVFFHIMRDAGQQATVSGLVRLKGANEYVEPIVKQVSAWNRMCDRMNAFAEWVDDGECPIDGVVIDEYLLKSINRFNL